MKKTAFFVSVLLTCVLAFAACEREDTEGFWEDDATGGQGAADAIRILDVIGGTGDIPVRFRLNPADGEPRTIRLQYQGACAGNAAWVEGVIVEPVENLAPGTHTVQWASWDTEAGCSGQVLIRLFTDIEGEVSDFGPVPLDNTQPGATGFFKTPLIDQGVSSEELPFFEWALELLLPDPNVDFVATRIGDYYEVHAERGFVRFFRVQTNAGYEYVIDEIDGANPIGNQDPTWLFTYEAEVAAGSNPNGVTYPEFGYDTGDERLSFIEPENDSYPYGYERIAAYFDHPDSADFMINWKSYAHAEHNLATHGSLSVVQSRSPLIFWGAGIEPGTGAGLSTRQVDVAPTVAKLLGFEKTFGVDHRGVWSHNVHLTWQDGQPIEPVLNGDEAGLVILVVSDGLTHTEVLRQTQRYPDKVPGLVRLVNEGAMVEFGSITNWPSVTYPSHNVIGAGVWSGHHGLVDNEYYLRDTDEKAEPINQLLLTDKYFNPAGPAETLHEAVHRNFGEWDDEEDGSYTVSLLDPSVHGADTADIEFRDRSGEIPFPPLGVGWPLDIPFPSLQFVDYMGVVGEQLLVQMAFVELYYALQLQEPGTPRYIILNIMATDGAGHEFGQHGDFMNPIMQWESDLFEVLFDWLEQFHLIDMTTIILTSDHGMQLGDISRSGWPIDTLRDAGFPLAAETSLGVYMDLRTEY